MTTRSDFSLMEGLSAKDIGFFLQQRLIDDRTRAFLEQIVALRSQIAELQKKVGDLQAEQKTIFSDQDRLRKNLQSLGQSEEERNLRSRIVKQLNVQEDRLETITKSVKDLQAQLAGRQEELTKLVTSYAFETK